MSRFYYSVFTRVPLHLYWGSDAPSCGSSALEQAGPVHMAPPTSHAHYRVARTELVDLSPRWRRSAAYSPRYGAKSDL